MKKYKIVFLRGDLEDGGLGIISALQANYLYDKGFDITVLVDKPYSQELIESSGAKLYNPNITIIPCLTSSKYLTTSPQVKRKKIVEDWFRGFINTYYDEYGVFVKKEWYDSDKRRIKIEIPIMEKYLNTLKEGDTVMVFQTSLMWYLANINLQKKISTIAQIHVQVFYTNKWLDNSDKHSAIVCLTQGTKNTYEKLYGKKKNIKVIPNPLRIPIPKNIIPHEQRNLKIIFVGLFIERKQPIDAIKAFIKIRKIYNDATLDLYGKGELEDDIKRFIEKNNLQKAVKIKGFISDISKIYSNASLMLFPTKSEAFGLVILEAMAFGVTTVMYSTVFGASELISNEQNGYVVEQGNINELAEKSIYLLENCKIRNQFANIGRKKVKKYQQSIIMPKWFELLKECHNIVIEEKQLLYNILYRFNLPSNLYQYIVLNFNKKEELIQVIEILKDSKAQIINGKPYIFSKKLIDELNIPLDILKVI